MMKYEVSKRFPRTINGTTVQMYTPDYVKAAKHACEILIAAPKENINYGACTVLNDIMLELFELPANSDLQLDLLNFNLMPYWEHFKYNKFFWIPKNSDDPDYLMEGWVTYCWHKQRETLWVGEQLQYRLSALQHLISCYDKLLLITADQPLILMDSYQIAINLQTFWETLTNEKA